MCLRPDAADTADGAVSRYLIAVAAGTASLRPWYSLASAAFARLRASTLAQNILALYGVQFFNYVFPLITVPYLARILKPEGWGSVAFAQAFGQYLGIVVEYGFSLSASREIAARRSDRQFIARTLSSVLFAKSLLAVPTLLAALIALRFVPFLREEPRLLWATLAWSFAQGMSLLWLYQGLERLRFISTIEVASKALVVMLLFLLIRRPDQGWHVLAVYAFGGVLSTGYALVAAVRTFGLPRPGLSDALGALRFGFTMFIFRSSVSVYTAGNAFILGLFVDARTVGTYAGAERISKGFLSLVGPITQALYPRMNALVAHNRREAALLATRALTAVMGAALAVAALIVIASPLLVRVVLGQGFQDSVPTLRLLSVLVPLVAASNMLGIQWMLPLRRDRAFNAIVISAGLLNLLLACLLAPTLRAPGMALSVIASETWVTLGFVVYLRSRSLIPLFAARTPRAS